MSAPAAHISVYAEDGHACIKIEGRANFISSIDFNTVLTQLRERGYDEFVIELSKCALMDSTFLGVLAGFGLRMTQDKSNNAAHPVELHNPNARITELLENLGILHLFNVTQGAVPHVEGNALDSTQPSHEQVTRTCLEAHRTLMEINPDNVARFKDVTKFLAEDLARMKSPQK